MTAAECKVRYKLWLKETEPKLIAAHERLRSKVLGHMRFCYLRYMASGWPVRDFISDEQPLTLEYE